MRREDRRRGFGFQLTAPVKEVATPTGKYVVYVVVLCSLIAFILGRFLSFEISLGIGVGLTLLLILLKDKILGHLAKRRAESFQRRLRGR